MQQEVHVRWRRLVASLRERVSDHVSGIHPKHLRAQAAENLHHATDIDGSPFLRLVLGLDLGPETFGVDDDEDGGPRTVLQPMGDTPRLPGQPLAQLCESTLVADMQLGSVNRG